MLDHPRVRRRGSPSRRPFHRVRARSARACWNVRRLPSRLLASRTDGHHVRSASVPAVSRQCRQGWPIELATAARCSPPRADCAAHGRHASRPRPPDLCDRKPILNSGISSGQPVFPRKENPTGPVPHRGCVSKLSIEHPHKSLGLRDVAKESKGGPYAWLDLKATIESDYCQIAGDLSLNINGRFEGQTCPSTCTSPSPSKTSPLPNAEQPRDSATKLPPRRRMTTRRRGRPVSRWTQPSPRALSSGRSAEHSASRPPRSARPGRSRRTRGILLHHLDRLRRPRNRTTHQAAPGDPGHPDLNHAAKHPCVRKAGLAHQVHQLEHAVGGTLLESIPRPSRHQADTGRRTVRT